MDADQIGRRRRWLGAVVVATMLVSVGCSGTGPGSDGADGDRSGPESVAPTSTALAETSTTAGPTTTAPPQRVATGDDEAFYATPEPLPNGDHGALIRYQVLPALPDGVARYRIMYRSESVGGEPITVTGLVAVPAGTAPTGGWKLLTHGHGSTGLADVCSPSVSVTGDGLNALEFTLLSSRATALGYVLASTDYEGLGTPGRHPFLVGVSEGRSVLDAARAARLLPGVDVSATTGIAGYSQGGHAVLWAHQLAAAWTPELDVIGTVGGAPASELIASVRPGAGGALQGEAVVSVVGGLATGDPAADTDTILTTSGRRLLAELDGACAPDPERAGSAPFLSADLATTEPWATLLADNTPGDVAAADPVLVIHSAADANIPIALSAQLLARQCRAGQVVERRVLPSGDHVAAAIPAYDQGLAWLDGLIAGATPASSCP